MYASCNLARLACPPSSPLSSPSRDPGLSFCTKLRPCSPSSLDGSITSIRQPRLRHDEKGRVDHAAGVFDRATKSCTPNPLSSALVLPPSGSGAGSALKIFDLKAEARIWPCLSYLCRIRSTMDHAAGVSVRAM